MSASLAQGGICHGSVAEHRPILTQVLALTIDHVVDKTEAEFTVFSRINERHAAKAGRAEGI